MRGLHNIKVINNSERQQRKEIRLTVDFDNYRKLWETSDEVFISGTKTNLSEGTRDECYIVFNINIFQSALKHWYSIKDEETKRIIGITRYENFKTDEDREIPAALLTEGEIFTAIDFTFFKQ